MGLKVRSKLSGRDDKCIDQLFKPHILGLYIMKGFADILYQPLKLFFLMNERRADYDWGDY